MLCPVFKDRTEELPGFPFTLPAGEVSPKRILHSTQPEDICQGVWQPKLHALAFRVALPEACIIYSWRY